MGGLPDLTASIGWFPQRIRSGEGTSTTEGTEERRKKSKCETDTLSEPKFRDHSVVTSLFPSEKNFIAI